MSTKQEGKILNDFVVSKLDQVVAVTTPIPASDGRVSRKTPIFHMPIYKINLSFDDKTQTDDETKAIDFNCDLADLTDLIDKLKTLRNQWRRHI